MTRRTPPRCKGPSCAKERPRGFPLCRDCYLELPPPLRAGLNQATPDWASVRQFYIDEGEYCRHGERPEDCKFDDMCNQRRKR